VMSRIGIKCSTAKNGREALRMIETNKKFDIYFIDWLLVAIDGIELTKHIKTLQSGKKSIVTMISSDWPSVKDKVFESGVDKYMMKPLFVSSIIESINECFEIENARMEKNFLDSTRGQFRGKRLLLAEDVEINREIVVSLLSETGVIIDEAENGLEALEMIKAEPERYDLVFMDMQMPKMDGLESTRQIRALPTEHVKTLPIIAMTANVFRDDIDRCLAAGMNAHIGKPLDMDEVFSVLRRHLRLGQYQAECVNF